MDEAIQIQQRSLSRSGLLKLGAVAALVLGAGRAAKALEGASAQAATDDAPVLTRAGSVMREATR